MSYFERMIAAVGNLDFTGDPVDDFADGASVLWVAALVKLPEAKREAYLARIECGDLNLRERVQQFGDACARYTRAVNSRHIIGARHLVPTTRHVTGVRLMRSHVRATALLAAGWK